MNQCADCKWHEATKGMAILHFCTNKENSPVGHTVWCKDVRENENLCGIQGKHFEKAGERG